MNNTGIEIGFANIYKPFVEALAKKLDGKKLEAGDLDFPSVGAGLSGVRFINRCVESNKNGSTWVDM